MQLTCPHCGEPIAAENINIQRMAAVCPACHTVFQFDPTDSKIKRRKIKQPKGITLDKPDSQLRMAFRTNFLLSQNEAFVISLIMSGVFTVITIMLIGVSVARPAATLFAVGFGLLTMLLYYWMALIAYNKTHIEMDDEQITVSRKPLPNFLSQPTTINLSGIERVSYEETPASKKEGYDTPRYHVWANVVDGHRKLIVSDVIEDYAVFISQRLNEHLELDAAPDVSHLVDDDQAEVGQSPDAFSARSESSHN